MRRSNSLSLDSNDQSKFVNRGELKVAKGKGCYGIRLKITVPMNNSSGGSVTPNATDKSNLLDHFRVTMRYGKSDRMPYKSLRGTAIRLLQRFCLGSDVEGYTDASTGLAQAIGAGQTKNLVFYLVIPTGRLWFLGQLRNIFAMGPSQAKTVELEVRRAAAPTLTAGLAISGTVTVEVQPLVASMKGDRFSYLPEYKETDTSDYQYTSEDGFPLLVLERTAAHASTALTRINMRIDQEEIHQDAVPADLSAEWNDIANYPAESLVTDVYTILYQATPDRELDELPTGRVYIEQPAKDLSTFKLGFFSLPVVSPDDRKRDVFEVAQNVRRKTIKAISVEVLENLDLPSRFNAFLPARMTDQQDAEHEKFPGIGSALGSSEADTKLVIPQSVLANARARYAAAKANGEDRAAEDVAKQVAKAVPGAAASGRGFDRGGIIYEPLRNAVTK